MAARKSTAKAAQVRLPADVKPGQGDHAGMHNAEREAINELFEAVESLRSEIAEAREAAESARSEVANLRSEFEVVAVEG